MIEMNLIKKLHSSSGEMRLSFDLTVGDGEFVSLFGQSGAGKTSILRMMAGLMQPDDGFIKVNGEFWFHTGKKIDLPPQKRKTGFMFQDYALFPTMSVRENLLFASGKNQDRKAVDGLIEAMELGDLQNHKPEKLSGGQKQRIALARALVQKPELLLLDEPLSSMDNELRAKLQDLISGIYNRRPITTFMVSHSVSEVYKLSKRVVLLEQGRIVKQGPPQEVFSSKQMSGKFQFTGEILKIERENILYIVSVLIGNNIVKLISTEEEMTGMQPGDKVLVASKAFNPVLTKVSTTAE